MNRRQFLQLSALTGLASSSKFLWAENQVKSAKFPQINRPIIVNLMLAGGPDFLHLMPPAFDAKPDSLGFKHWQARAGVHNLTDKPASWQQRWQQDYVHMQTNTPTFGILKQCDWLIEMFNQGNVTIYTNVTAGKTRNHHHCQLVMELGDSEAGLQAINQAGWGGKYAVRTKTNIVSLTQSPRKICHCPDPNNPAGYTQSHVIPAANTREMVLYEATKKKNSHSILARSLKNYYAAKQVQMPVDSIYRKIVDTESVLRQLGQPITQRLAEIPVPTALQALMKGNKALKSKKFALQTRNLYDALACQDIFNMSMASMDYVGWDSHKNQKENIEPKFQDLFGKEKALDSLYTSLDVDVSKNLVWLIGGEFARTFKANGAQGSDHAKTAQTMLVINTGKQTKNPINDAPITINNLIKTLTG